jgi:carbamoyl-phosphate synthase large subunit
MKSVTVYLNSAGATNAANIIMALRRSGICARIVAGDMDPLAAGLFLADKGYVVPPADSSDFMPVLLDVCHRENVDIALPVYSADFPVFTRNKELLASEGIKTYAVSAESWAICDDKYRVVEAMTKLGISCPLTWSYEQSIRGKKSLPYPLLMKRRSGSGSKGIQKLENPKDLGYHLKPQYIVQEYLEGDELTVDVISDLSGVMLAASPRVRTKIYGGLSVRGITISDEKVVESTKRIVEGLKLVGPSNVQCKYTSKGELQFFDVNPRFASGGLPLAVAAGMNSPEILVRLIMGWEIPKISVQSGVIMVRYWDSVFLKQSVKDGKYEILD